VCGTAKPTMPSQNNSVSSNYTSYAYVTGVLNSRLSTRTGPSTTYDEPGTFFSAGTTVSVLSRAFDNRNGIWWVQVDFRNGSKNSYRVWTGVKRVDVDLNRVKEDPRICDCDIYPTSDTWFGPGGNYARANISINRSACGTIRGKENGYVDVEYWYEDDGYDGSHRVWLPESAVYNLYYGDYSGEN
jgi:hypothetical protein